jgi:signal transduction histidine kinase/CheY-like chemotaxis protein/ligand-binding sensor domain-containing protein/AraC-like DNA-binding protein
MENTIKLKYIWGILLLALHFVFVKGQPICVARQYTVRDGLIQSNPAQILQSHNGFIWVSTWNGVSRFDGRDFETFQFDSLLNQHMQRLENTADGNLWMIAYDRHSLYLYDIRENKLINVLKQYEQHFNTPLQIENLYPLSKGITWVTLNNGGCFRISDKECTVSSGIQYITAIDDVELGKVSRVFEDKQGEEWVFSDKGVSIFGKRTISSYPFSMFETMDNLVFLASQNGRLAYYDVNTMQFNIVPFQEKIQHINGIKVLKDNQLAVLSDKGLYLCHFPELAMEKYDFSLPGHDDAAVRKVYQDSKGFLWIFTGLPGIIRLDPETGVKQYLNTPSGYMASSPENELFIYEDPNGVVWTIPYKGIFSYYDEKSRELKVYFTPGRNHIPYSPIIKTTYVDKQNNLWIKSQRSFIKMFFPPSPYTYRELDNYFDTKSFLFDSDEHLWIATKKGIIRIMDSQKNLLGYLSPDGELAQTETVFAEGGIYVMLKDQAQTIWLGSKENGLFRLVPRNRPYHYEVYHYMNNPSDPYSISDNKISCIDEDHNGRIWIGTYGGGLNLVEEKEDGAIRFIHAENNLSGFPINRTNSIRCMVEGLGHTMLVGTIEGLITFSSDFSDYENIRFYLNLPRPQATDGLCSADVMSVLRTTDETIYCYCYGGGLCKLVSSNLLSDELRFRSFGKETSPLARDLIEDKNHNIWIGSETDITLFDVHDQTFESFGETFFNRSFNYSECLPVTDRQGDILMGTEGGMLVFSPDSIVKQTYEAPIVVTGIKYSEDNLSHVLSDADYLEIPTRRRNFTISFAALDYTNSLDIEYAYKLDDNQWYYIGKKNSVSFVSLPAGKYQFQIKATNGDGIWMNTVKTVTLQVLPTFWETGWAKAFYLVVVLVISLAIGYIFFYIYYFLKSATKLFSVLLASKRPLITELADNYYLKHKVNMEQRLAEIKVRSFIDISHELRTPLTLISGPVSEVLSQEPLTSRTRHHLQLVQKNINRMLLLINQVLDFRKIQNKKMGLTIEYRDIIIMLHNIMDNFRLLATEKNINFSLQTTLPSVFLWIDSDKFEKIIFNLLSNAFKYTPDNKSITLIVMESGQFVSIAVKDEGIGISKDKVPSIFERFTTVSKENDMQPSSGIGLSLVNELVKMLHGEIQVESEVKKGSVFKLVLHKGKEIYAQDKNVEYILNDTSEEQETVLAEPEQNDKTSLPDMPPATKETLVKVMVVEDNAELRQFICEILSGTYRVVGVADGVMALEKIEEEIPDFIITDIMMPRMDGIELIRHIKENVNTCDIPLIILSAKSSVEDRIQCLQLGIDDYIPKPFSSDYLKSRIENLIRQRKVLQSAFLSKYGAQPKKEPLEAVAYPVSQIVPLDELFMQKLVGFMEENYSNPGLRVNDLAEFMNMSRSVFNRKVNGIMGISPIEYIKNYRLNKAKSFIQSGMSFSEVAFAVGFSDPGYFGKAFKKAFNQTLTEYKNNN